ncbi:MAG: hydrolase 2, exosortase A system-associated [Gammaproteobacteria bacterium]|nr:hydrolase 2, exosortase A system-associated [Gammaproteobacteria bacterium]
MKNNSIITFPFFNDSESGKIFCTYFKSTTINTNQAVVFVPPFAEEMNKSRRMFSQQARRLASNGINSILVDLYGTGDSEGEFYETTWDTWVSDIICTINWLKNQGKTSIGLVALRLGCLLAIDVAQKCNIQHIVFWQPVINGDNYLGQFLRLRLAAEMNSVSGEKSSVKNLKDMLNSGENVEVAGYMLSSKLAIELQNKQLDKFTSLKNTKTIFWYDIVADSNREPPLIHRKTQEQIREKNIHMESFKIAGASFWNCVEIVDIKELLQSTEQALLNT